MSDLKYFKVWCEYDIGNDDHPNTAYYQAESEEQLIDNVFRDADWLEDGETIEYYLDDLLHIREVKLSDIIYSI